VCSEMKGMHCGAVTFHKQPLSGLHWGVFYLARTLICDMAGLKAKHIRGGCSFSVDILHSVFDSLCMYAYL
jgi:hypothetical protein